MSDFNLGLNIQQWISLRQFHPSRVVHEIWIRRDGGQAGGIMKYIEGVLPGLVPSIGEAR